MVLLGVVFLALLGLFLYAVFSGYGEGEVAARFALVPGETVVEMTGLGDRLVLRLRRADGGERIVYVDSRNGRTLGGLDLGSRP